MSWKLFLDDERLPPEATENEFTIARSYDEAVKLVQEKGCPTFISFDHDLGEGKTGYDFAKWLVDEDLEKYPFFPHGFDYVIHSQNPIGANNIKSYLDVYLCR